MGWEWSGAEWGGAERAELERSGSHGDSEPSWDPYHRIFRHHVIYIRDMGLNFGLHDDLYFPYAAVKQMLSDTTVR